MFLLAPVGAVAAVELERHGKLFQWADFACRSYDSLRERHGVESRVCLNVVDGCIPSDMSTGSTEEIEEERRLIYVAMTRANELSLMVPQRFYVHQQSSHGDRHVYASRTRFVPEKMTHLFEACSWPMAIFARSLDDAEFSSAKTVDLAARVRRIWERAKAN